MSVMLRVGEMVHVAQCFDGIERHEGHCGKIEGFIKGGLVLVEITPGDLCIAVVVEKIMPGDAEQRASPRGGASRAQRKATAVLVSERGERTVTQNDATSSETKQ